MMMIGKQFESKQLIDDRGPKNRKEIVSNNNYIEQGWKKDCLEQKKLYKKKQNTPLWKHQKKKIGNVIT